ncbi:unnamed protein product [Rhodiola kirilowii]
MRHLRKHRSSFLLINLPARLQPRSLSTAPSAHITANPNLVLLTRHDRGQHRDVSVTDLNKMISSYVRSGDFDSALRLFNETPFKTTVTWNSILAWYAKRRGKLKDAQKLFDRIPEPDVVSYNTMLACYLRDSGIEVAGEFFDKMTVKDVASWNTMVTGFVRSGRMREARGLFDVMPEKNCVSWSAMVAGYVEAGDLENAEKCFLAAPKSVVAWTAMISGYMKFGKVDLAEKLFWEMTVKNLVTWNATIAGYVENRQANDALKLFKVMVELGVRPNGTSFCSVLLGISNLSALILGRQVHQLISKSPMIQDTTACTSLISMYCKCGDLEGASRLFLEMRCKDLVTWNAMISGFAQHGEGMKALVLFDKMKEEGNSPDWITFVAVISACNHVGLVDLGIQHFESMKTDYGIDAKPDHYTCMVDLFGRAGKLIEAVELIKGMPYPPRAPVFGTLLGACRLHKNLEIAEYASQNLLHVDPTNAAGYVQLANAYASVNRWDQVSRVRRLMKDSAVVKPPGYSWIELGKVVHEFRSSDRLHPDIPSILEKLSELKEKTKRAGYVPEFEYALHDVGNEMKGELLLRHSEKLAIAFGLIRTGGGMVIRVFKNLRVCGDCHSWTKYVSAIEGREIVVRDTTRFHHFKDGRCSCEDYW